MSFLEYGGFKWNISQGTFYSLVCISLNLKIFHRFAIEHYTNPPSFSLTDAFLGQSRGVKLEKFSVASDPTMVGFHNSHLGHVVDW